MTTFPAAFSATCAATGELLPGTFAEATSDQIHSACQRAADAAIELRSAEPQRLSQFLSAVATEVRVRREAIVERCEQETGYVRARVEGEFERATGQLDLFARLAVERPWDRTAEDPADPDRKPFPKPRMTRRFVPLGPVAVFGACNFPLAISVIGNDFVAAIATGNPVIVKSHPSHPGTCELLGQAVKEAIRKTSMPDGTFELLHGRTPQTSLTLVQNPAISAVGFTGSPQGGRALAKAVLERDNPIPIFAELGSTNPVFLTREAIADRMTSIAEGFAASLRFGNGHMCTKPGVVVIHDDDAEAFIDATKQILASQPNLPMLSGPIAEAFDQGVAKLRAAAEVDELFIADASSTDGPWHRGAHWFAMPVETAINDHWLHSETFGPLSILVRCPSEPDMIRVAEQFHGSLTSTIHCEDAESDFCRRWRAVAERFSGRIVFNGWPTGMEFGAATQHGGPFPASLDASSTSVGHSSTERFVRPLCYQNWP
ncbi:aldehyde dehydrogenase (NADP(+)) [Rhodopirellula halodulae]|uniref:aldehyde dehydrogenase (NADP(+)) n=1 Tax=Rhodopirellula halodulae TaxID=2894198 RepID=UPI001E4A422A|nr:aldehyde dehydrogenase (NADP(+)) [Rhodopirellula sp. JC737]MCC9655512.1 aldehyde dehydrogenase (NADP(+)) [Rhodopirellula sp. JC737]